MSTRMMDKFLKQIEARGLSISRGDGDTLLLSGPKAEKTPEVMAACKAFKTQLLQRFNGELANDPANVVAAEDVVQTHAEATDADFAVPTSAKNPKASEWVTCLQCKADVNPTQLSDPVTWNQCCGITPTKNNGPCPYRPSSR